MTLHAASAEPLRTGARAMGLELDERAIARLEQLLAELSRWNRAYNLTAIDDPARMVTHHLLDSLAIHFALRGRRVADVGTGAGFPGLPLAVLNPGREFTLLDSSAKKLRFVTHAARALGLDNVRAVHARVEQADPGEGYDVVVSRAFASLPDFVGGAAHLLAPGGWLLAMKGRWPQPELDQLDRGWQADAVALTVPGLEEARHLVVLRRPDPHAPGTAILPAAPHASARQLP